MKRTHVLMGLAVIAALAIASPVFGISSSLKKAIKKEVARQIGKAQGPAGTNGTNGVNGANGTARAYARVDQPCAGSCTLDHNKGLSVSAGSIPGTFCVTAAGIDPATVAPVATVDSGDTADAGNASVHIQINASGCPATAFKMDTMRQTVAAGPVLNAGFATDIAFTVIVP